MASVDAKYILILRNRKRGHRLPATRAVDYHWHMLLKHPDLFEEVLASEFPTSYPACSHCGAVEPLHRPSSSVLGVKNGAERFVRPLEPRPRRR